MEHRPLSFVSGSGDESDHDNGHRVPLLQRFLPLFRFRSDQLIHEDSNGVAVFDPRLQESSKFLEMPESAQGFDCRDIRYK